MIIKKIVTIQPPQNSRFFANLCHFDINPFPEVFMTQFTPETQAIILLLAVGELESKVLSLKALKQGAC